jgi:hypothetical protein
MQDQTSIKLKQFIQNGWPQNSNSLDPDIKQYWKERDSLVILDEVIFKNNKAVVPQSLRKEMLNLLHYNHLGIDKCQYRARQCIYWPNINNDIKNLVLNCEICLKFRNSNIKEPLRVGIKRSIFKTGLQSKIFKIFYKILEMQVCDDPYLNEFCTLK